MSALFEACAEIARPLGVKKPDPDLTWREFDDLGDKNWTLHLGYSVEWDEGDCSCWIHRAQLNTGQQLLELDVRGIDSQRWEAECAALEYDEAHQAAMHLNVPDKCDDGDYSLDAQRDRLAMRESDEGML